MVLKDNKIDQFNKERQDLLRKLDKSPDDEDLKRQLKNVNERIRVRTKKLEEDPSIAEIVVVKVKGSRQNSIKATILKAWNDDKLKDSKEIAKKYDFKLASVRWYVSKLQLN